MSKVLWCEWLDEEFYKSWTMEPNSHYFQTPALFTRWLFEQPRGANVDPWATLVVGWREAKPCMWACEAASSGNTEHLRPDGQRAHLPGNHGVPAGIAVHTIVVKLEKPQQENKAVKWAKSVCKATFPHSFDIHIAHDDEHLARLIARPHPGESKRSSQGLVRADRGEGLPYESTSSEESGSCPPEQHLQPPGCWLRDSGSYPRAGDLPCDCDIPMPRFGSKERREPSARPLPAMGWFDNDTGTDTWPWKGSSST
jgi:hypothetical protein